MPATSRDQRLAKLEAQLLSSRRYVDACLVVDSHEGVEIFRVGGRWDRVQGAYVPGPCREHHVALQESQCINEDGTPGVAYGFARYLASVRAGDSKRARLIIAGGNRGSGKTWICAGVFFTACALEWPGEWQFGVNLTSSQKRECVESIADVARPEWIGAGSEDPRDPFAEFVTGSKVGWVSAQNPKRLRQAKLRIRHVLLNEGQDQTERNYHNAIGAIRNCGGFVSVATNPPQQGAGDWVATIWNAIESGEVAHRGEIHKLDNKKNRAVDQVALDDIGVLQRAVSQEAADADSGGQMKLSGPIAYKNFRALPFEKGGHVGDPPKNPQIGKVIWRDVTRERTADAMGGGSGFDWLIGADFQRRPGIIGIACKLYLVEREWADGPRTDDGKPLAVGSLVIYAGDQINCPGDESSFCDALERKGYSPQGQAPDGRPAPSALIIGDGTGAKQNAAHRWELPTSFASLKANGWSVLPPRFTRKRKAENPTVKESRSQMWDLFNSHLAIVSPRLKEWEGGFAGLIGSIRGAKVNAVGNLVGGYHHAPDGFRYVCWWAGPKTQPPMSPPMDDRTFNDVRGLRLLTSG